MKKSLNGQSRAVFFLSLLICLLLSGGAIAGEAFSVKEFSPQGEVKEAANILIDFSASVVVSDDVGKSLTRDEWPVVFNP
ncbi:MAG: hypothetical protein LBS53_04395, partial [Synergistaceae bacterium]|nr:hypothetical protein [Synergistaceae bacterium]